MTTAADTFAVLLANLAREYGAGPSRWRRHPTRTQSEGPSGVHLHPPGSLRLPTLRVGTPMDLTTRMIEHHLWLTDELSTVQTGWTTRSSTPRSRCRSAPSTTPCPSGRSSAGSWASWPSGTPRPGRLDDTVVDVT